MASPSWTAERPRRALAGRILSARVAQGPGGAIWSVQIRRSPHPWGMHGRVQERRQVGAGRPSGTAQRIWSSHRGELRDGTASAAADYALTVQAATRDAVRAA